MLEARIADLGLVKFEVRESIQATHVFKALVCDLRRREPEDAQAFQLGQMAKSVICHFGVPEFKHTEVLKVR